MQAAPQENRIQRLRVLITGLTALYGLMSLLMGGFYLRFHDPGLAVSLAYVLAGTGIMLWGRKRLSFGEAPRAVDALYITILAADLVGAWRSPNFLIAAIVPVIAAALTLSYFEGRALKIRLIGAWAVAVASILLHACLQRELLTPLWYQRFSPGLNTALLEAMVFFILWQFKSDLNLTHSQRDDAMSQAEASAMRSRQVVETSEQGIWIIDASLRVVFANRRLELLLGAAPEGLVGTDCGKFLGEADQKLLRLHLESRLAMSEPAEMRLACQNGSSLWVLASMSPLEGGALLMATDISERRRLEGKLQQGIRLETVGRLAGGLAHDFSALLAKISLGAESLEECLAPGHAARADLEAILNARERADGLIRQLLAFSRRQKLEARWLDLGKVLEGMQSVITKICGEKIALEWMSPGSGFPVRADLSQVEQVLLNLAVNARDAMPGGGSLKISLRQADLDAKASGQPEAKSGRYAVLMVSDSGSGIAPENLGRIFEPFFSTKERSKGTGLGLATVYGIVRQSGGFINVQSLPGEGTAFEVYLPLDEAGA